MVDGEEEQARRRNKFAAKRYNEHIKLIAGFFNTLALGVIGTSLIIPAIANGLTLLSASNVIWILVGLSLHLSAHVILRLLKTEEV